MACVAFLVAVAVDELFYVPVIHKYHAHRSGGLEKARTEVEAQGQAAAGGARRWRRTYGGGGAGAGGGQRRTEVAAHVRRWQRTVAAHVRRWRRTEAGGARWRRTYGGGGARRWRRKAAAA